MRRTAPLTRIALVLPVLALAAGIASAQVDFGSFVNFGDSLTHNDILGTVYGTPQALYGADPMEAVFLKAQSPGDDLYRFAVAGSQSGDVLDQISWYSFLVGLGLQEQATLISLEAGANDILDNFALLAANAPGESAAADAVIDAIIDNLRDAFLQLRGSHPGARFIVWTIPDITVTPRYLGLITEQEQANIRAHVFRVNRPIRRGVNRSRVSILDVETALLELIANPPVLRGQPLVPPPAHGDFDDIFADEIHPTGVTNALAANVEIAALNLKWNDTIPTYTEDELADIAQIP